MIPGKEKWKILKIIASDEGDLEMGKRNKDYYFCYKFYKVIKICTCIILTLRKTNLKICLKLYKK